MGKLFPARESLISDIPAGDGKMANLFLQCGDNITLINIKVPQVKVTISRDIFATGSKAEQKSSKNTISAVLQP